MVTNTRDMPPEEQALAHAETTRARALKALHLGATMDNHPLTPEDEARVRAARERIAAFNTSLDGAYKRALDGEEPKE